jgi:prepilin-type N-terminal cleavage/methylation domain-containing protein
MKKTMQFHKIKTKGFTVVELMIATTVFSLILLICTTAIIQIGRVYYKGVTSAHTQEVARTIMDEISRSLQFTDGGITPTPAPAPGTTQVFCAGNKQYSYILGNQLTDVIPPPAGKAKNALVSEDITGACGSVPRDLINGVTGGVNLREHLDLNMRLAVLEVRELTPGSNLWAVHVQVVTGDDDVLNPAKDGCANAQAGTQFCATSELKTVIKKRIN